MNASLPLPPPSKLHSKTAVAKRLFNLFALVIVGLISINLWQLSSEQAQNWHDNQANQLGRSLAAQNAKVLSDAMLADERPQMVKVLNFVYSDPHVLGAALFDQYGQLVHNEEQVSSVVSSHLRAKRAPLVFVEEIKHQGRILGYLRLQLNEPEVMRFHEQYQHQLNQQMQLLALLAATLGMLFTRSLYKWRLARYKRNNPPLA